MKRHSFLWQVAQLGLGLSLFLAIGCASTQKAELNNQVGRLTYEQAVTDMGPPCRTNDITDGGLIAQWITRRPASTPFSQCGTGFYSPYAGVSTFTGDFATRVLVMKFGPDHKLVEWARVTR